jgi:hypothetical protein
LHTFPTPLGRSHRSLRLRNGIFVAALTLAACTPGSMDEAATDLETAARTTKWAPSMGERTEVLGTLQRLFDALESGDEELLRHVMDPSVVMHFSETRGGMTTYGSSTLDGLAERITSSEVRLVERMWDPIVLMDFPMATIWAPYDFYAGSELSHCGVDVASLMRTPDGWKIIALSWTRMQPPACELHPDGPPTADGS